MTDELAADLATPDGGDNALFAGWSERYSAWLAESRDVLRTGEFAPLKHYPHIRPQSAPFVPWPGLPLAQARVGLISSAGFYLKNRQEPFAGGTVEGDTGFRELPDDVTPEEIAIAHEHYPHGPAEQDWNVIFPVDRLRELVAEGLLGALGPLWSFSGYCLDLHEFYEQTAKTLAGQARQAGCDAVLLVPV